MPLAEPEASDAPYRQGSIGSLGRQVRWVDRFAGSTFAGSTGSLGRRSLGRQVRWVDVR